MNLKTKLRIASYLLTALFVFVSLPCSSAFKHQEQNNITEGKTTILFDFENGTFDGWTLTGDCWDKEPATTKTFVDRQGNPLVSGIVGNGYLTTLYKNTTTTGKAVSKEFVINKPFLTFKIGGGRYPKQACLNLIVEGKVVRSETGSDSAELRPASWDVSLLMGVKTHFEIVDNTNAAQRGYIMVDDIHLSTFPIDKQLLNIENSPTLAQFGVKPYFLPRSAVKFTQPYGNGDCSPLFDFGVTPQVFKNLVDVVCVHGYRFRHDPQRSIKQTAQLLCADVDQRLIQAGLSHPKKLLVDWLRSEAICAYVFSNVKFDDDGLKKREAETRDLQERPFKIFSMENPVALCPAFSKITTELAYEAQLKCCTINGVCRWKSDEVKHDDGHSWVMFDFGDGIRVPADVTPMHPIYASSPMVTSKISWHCLPCTPRAWELVMRMHWPHIVRWTPEGEFSNGGKPTIADRNQHNPKLDIVLFEGSWDEWYAVNSKPYWDLESWYLKQSYEYVPSR